MQAVVNRIIPFSTVDGPGNRTAVFFQGCNMNCKYCHNPETLRLCKHCGRCINTCPAAALSMEAGKVQFDRSKCKACDTCIHTCPYDSSPKTENLSPEEVFQRIQKQIPFIRGITVSGGECTLYPDFLQALFQLCKAAGLTTLIDSNGTYDFSKDDALLKVTDGVMLDMKAFDPNQHELVTGIANARIITNAIYLAKHGKLYEIRTVVVPELFDAEDTIIKTGRLLKPYLDIADIRYKIITYRSIGVRKEYSHYEVPKQEYLKHLSDLLIQEGFQNVIMI